MSIQFDVPIRNGMLDVFEALLGPNPILKIFNGTLPMDTTGADPGTTLSTIILPSDWMLAAANGTKLMLGSWEDQAADNDGTATCYRFYTAAGVCRAQGPVSLTNGGSVLTVDDTLFKAGKLFRITAFALTAGNR